MRNITSKALILSTKPKGESNRLISLFTPEDGIISATLYGGPKSKLRAQVAPMNSGIIYLYKDEVKKSVKISDFDVKNYHFSFRENLFKTFAASLASEILIKTHCAGNSEQAWILLNGFLDGMDYFDEKEARIGLVRFLWRYIFLLGVQPDTECCSQCGIQFSNQIAINTINSDFSKNNFIGKNEFDTLSYKRNNLKNIFDLKNNCFVCADCFKSQINSIKKNKFEIEISSESINYLQALMNLSPKEARNLTVNDTILGEIKNLCFILIENICGTKLKTLETCAGIL